jgi:N-dimethylarginine dimethylaminohydrolase
LHPQLTYFADRAANDARRPVAKPTAGRDPAPRPRLVSHDEWSPLEEVILGTTDGWEGIFTSDVSVAHFFGLPPEALPTAGDQRSKVRQAVAEMEEDLAAFEETLKSGGVIVRRPRPREHRCVELPGWRSGVFYSLAPRDSVLVVGETVIEAAMPCRARYMEAFPLRAILADYFAAGARWLSPPKPQLPDRTYEYSDGLATLPEEEVLFDAANVLRGGEDLLYNVSNTANRRGAEWLRRVLGPRYRVHEVAVAHDHIDTTLVLLRPDLVLVNGGRLTPATLPPPLHEWRQIWFHEPVDEGYAFGLPLGSPWMSMNVFSIDEDTVIVGDKQRPLIRLLEKEGLTVVPQPFRHARTFGSAFHCCALDTRRRGALESWFPASRERDQAMPVEPQAHAAGGRVR